MGRHHGQLGTEHVAGERAGDGQVEDPPGQAGLAAEFGQNLAHVAAIRAVGAEALCGRVTEHHPQRSVIGKHLVVVRLPVTGEDGAVLAHRGDPVGPAAERAGAQS